MRTIELKAFAIDAIAKANICTEEDARSKAFRLLRHAPLISFEEFLYAIASRVQDTSVTTLPHIHDFGEPSFPMALNENWIFEIIAWNMRSTSMHEHTFEGAFKVVTGPQILNGYEFKSSSHPHNGVEVGTLKWTDTRVLNVGDCEIISTGERGIHSLWSLEKPALLYVLRTVGDGEGWDYLWPSLRFRRSSVERIYTSREKYLDALEAFSEKIYVSCLNKLSEQIGLNNKIYLAIQRFIRPDNTAKWPALFDAEERDNDALSRALIDGLSHLDHFLRFNELRGAATSPYELATLALSYHSHLQKPDLVRMLHAHLCEAKLI
ncbi:hypothetical protein [Massilia sp. IC2-476]|uniref:hypothetical protein n=1 Tax=Massilia sp. IC2-476 TaxID=2887199 RepID=UPI001D12B297|nr:hypothetical protein [Massilia sp. IC2-476]MCC2973581.1 hypothetical protein [Massilia sp. IC2-476]